eukprot:TRINITY_DN4427_c0_g1_i2.p1 TRINITY_DN4427_c0_g1~~TRINITY_DN4427_c0_g1_i2.p1  ORF type:complete len:141 (-),score=32.75 TRINITY_DN4427_c0_g1_i2:120-542(-)
MHKQSQETGHSIIPITVRQLEAIIRIAESLARMQLQPVATAEHVNEAIRLFNVSTFNAAQVGAISGEGLAGSDYMDKIRKAEARVKRRLMIGGTMPTRALIQEVVKLGEDEQSTRKAIDNMVRSGELQYTNQRRMVRRNK